MPPVRLIPFTFKQWDFFIYKMRIKSIAKCGITFINGSKLQEIHIQGTNKTFVNWKDIDVTDDVK